MEKQLTAVEFAFEELNKWRIENFGEGALIGIPQEVLDKAKEMEKQRLEQFYNHGQWAIIEHGHGDTFEDYYNRTFKSE
jgi:hypothetical protein